MSLKEVVFMVEENPEGGYAAKALGYPIFTEGDTISQLKENIKNAIKCHFDREEDIPKIIHIRIVKEETIAYA